MARSAMLVYQNRISIRVDHHEVRRAARILVGLRCECDPARLEAALKLADIGERVERLRALVPARIEGEQFFSNMPWKRPNAMSPFLRISQPFDDVARKRREAVSR